MGETQTQPTPITRADLEHALRAKAAEALILSECIGSNHDLALCVPYIQRMIDADHAYDLAAIELGMVALSDRHGPATAIMRALDRCAAIARSVSPAQSAAVVEFAVNTIEAQNAIERAGDVVPEHERRIAHRGRRLTEAFQRFRAALADLDTDR